jgi:homoserine kinase type II
MAIYTTLSQPDIEGFLAQYDVGNLVSFTGIAEGVSNTNYLIETTQAKFILTLFEKHFKLEELPYFVELMKWWQQKGIHCPKPIQMKDGRALAALKEKPALMVSFLEGSGIEPRKITLEHCYQLGELAASMHVQGAGFPYERKNGMGVPQWEALIDKNLERFDEIMPGLRKLVSEEFNYLSEHWPSELPGGPVHADLFPDNVFFKDKKLAGVIDLYFSCHESWAYDLAICVNAWCFDVRGKFEKERVQALMQGYNQMRPLTLEEEASMPLLLRGAALRFLLTRADQMLNPDEGATFTAKDPMEYAKKLEFFQSIEP